MSSSQSEICKFFRGRKGCKNGTNCQFLHEGGPPDDQQRNEHGHPEEQVNSRTDDNYELETTEDVNHRICWFFANGKTCRYGKDCRFLHIEEKLTAPAESSTENATTQDEPDPEHDKEQKMGNRKKKHDEKDVRICDFYAKTKRCKFGNRCKFAHIYKAKPEMGQKSKTPKDRTKTLKPEPEDAPGALARAPVCRYFKEGHCRSGNSCKFFHPETTAKPLNPKVEQSKYPKVQPVRFQERVMLNKLSDSEIDKMRTSEIESLKKRFPKFSFIKENDGYEVVFCSTDPDWPYDVKDVTFAAIFPVDYPIKPLCISLPREQEIPISVQDNITEAATSWIMTRHQALMNEGKVEMMFKPMLKWLDRKLEDLFTEGLKQYRRELMLAQAQADGFEFIPAKQATDQRPLETLGTDETPEDNNKQEEVTYINNKPEDEASSVALTDISNTDPKSTNAKNEPKQTTSQQETDKTVNSIIDPIRKGTEATLKNLQLKENTATLLAKKIMVVVQCERCKGRCDITTPPNRLNSIPCAKCNSDQLLTFRPAMMHQFSSILGYFDVKGCLVLDLILQECDFMTGCLNCSKEVKLSGLNPGQANTMWCQICHSKLLVATDTTQFKQLQPSEGFDQQASHVIKVAKAVKAVKDPSVKEGKPLPDNGTCKHYKKSYRWLRFPCCGKCYPCDVCHDAQEGDHDMKLANRMICGFCAHEQPYAAEKPCTLCGKSMTNRSTAFWEGGKGCRDKIKMSKDENRKFAGANKTVSKKAQAKKDPSSKKTVKVRHA
ncbi:unnamed protein product [Owenia fusiformis]|uniref:Uncharacterized protein n=1 Tax=Owenia fusiformis TaxID=6347 RepID=A0A8J1TYU3_OWEFU|nr:unnamed protein product [Owenia fusiformis]